MSSHDAYRLNEAIKNGYSVNFGLKRVMDQLTV